MSFYRSIMVFAIATLLLALAGQAARAQSVPVLSLEGPVGPEDLVGHIEAVLDPERTETAATMLDVDTFEPVTTEVVNFGYTAARVWLRFRLRSATEEIESWRLVFSDDFLSELDVTLLRSDGSVETAIKSDDGTPFGARPIDYGKLVAPFELKPGDAATVLVRYRSEGLTAVSMRIESAASFANFVADRTLLNAFFYGTMSILVLVALVCLAVTRLPVFVAYCGYSTALTLHFMKIDGVAFQYLWPNLPVLRDQVSLWIGPAIYVFAAMFARTFLQTAKLHPWLDKVWITVAGIAVGCVALSPFVDQQRLNAVLVQMSAPIALLMVVSGLVAARTRFREVRLFLLGWIGAVVVAIIGAARHAIGLDLSRDAVNDVQRAWLVFDALLMGLAIADRYNQERRAAQRAMQSNLDQAQRNLRLSARLNELEALYARTESRARFENERFQNTVHDIRQPLAAVRMKLGELLRSGDANPQGAAELETSFRYVEDLVSEQLQRMPAADEHGLVAPDGTPPDLAAILRAIEDMFGDEARRGGGSLRCVPSTAKIAIPPLVAIRCLMNLVSNAIKYAPGSRILVGVRRRNGKVALEVHDGGPGLSEAAFELALGRATRMHEGSGGPDGQGFGLSIVAEAARAHGFTVRRLRSRGGGLSVAFEMELPNETAPDIAEATPGPIEAPAGALVAEPAR